MNKIKEQSVNVLRSGERGIARGGSVIRVAVLCLAGFFAASVVRANYADEIGLHVQSIGIYLGYTYDTRGQGTEAHPGGGVEAETDATVSQIIVQPPAPAAAFTLEQDRRRTGARRDSVWWGREFYDATAFDALPDGNYTVTFWFADGSSAAVAVPFTREDSAALQIPDQVPILNQASVEKLVTGGPDITFSWPACTDPAANGVYFGMDGDYDIPTDDYETTRSLAEDATAQHTYDPDPDLPAGVFEVDLAFVDYRAGTTTEGIEFEVAKFREQEFVLVVSQPDAALQQHLLDMSLSLGTDPTVRDDALHFHAEVRTSGQVQTLAMSVPNSWVDNDQLWNWQQRSEQDGTKTWTLDETFTSLQDFVDRYGFGPFGVYLQWNDGRATVSRMTHVYFSAAAGTLTPLELPQQDPQFTAPAAGAFLASPVTFQWNAWPVGDPAYASELAGIRFAVGNSLVTPSVVDVFLAKTAVDSGPRALAEGNYRAALYFGQLRQGPSTDSIQASCALYRVATRDFSVGQAGQLQVPIEPQAVHALGVQWSIDGGTVWHDPDETVSLAPGQYTIHCNAPNWNVRAPTDAVVTVVAGQTVQQTMTYGQVVLSIDAALLIENGRYVADIWTETGPEITGVSLQTAAGATFDLTADFQRDATTDWEHHVEDLPDFSQYGDGWWTFVFTRTDNSEHSVSVRFAHSDGTPLQMPAQAPAVQQPQVAHQRARMTGPDLTFQWTPYTGVDANLVHVDIESRGVNVWDTDHWSEYYKEFNAPLGAGRDADSGACAFTNVLGGVYRAGFYLGDAEESGTSELIDVFVAKARGTLADLLVSVPNDPLDGIVDGVQLRRLTVTSVNQTVSGLFRADITPASGAIIDGVRLRSPADEWLQLQINAQTGHLTALATGSTATISQRFPSGFYDLEVQYNDGRVPAYGTLGVEAVEADLADLADVIQVPELTAPVGQTTSPINFSWAACTDSAATAVAFLVRGAAVENEWLVQQMLASTVDSLSGVDLDPAAYVARLVFLNRRGSSVSRVIAMDVGFGRAADFPFTVTGAVSTTDVVLELQPGWNLISLPVTPYPQSYPEVIFAGKKLGPVWTWNGPLHTFEIATVLEGKRGYWVYASVAAPTQITVSGTVLYDGNIHLAHAWNLVGAVLDAEGHVDVPSGCSAWGWDGSRYQPADSFEYVRGYWLYCPVPGGEDVNLGD